MNLERWYLGKRYIFKDEKELKDYYNDVDDAGITTAMEVLETYENVKKGIAKNVKMLKDENTKITTDSKEDAKAYKKNLGLVAFESGIFTADQLNRMLGSTPSS